MRGPGRGQRFEPLRTPGPGRRIVTPALRRVLAHEKVGSQVEVTGVRRQRVLAHETGAESSERAFVPRRKAVIEDLADKEVKERIAQKFEALVRLQGLLRIDAKERTVGEGAPVEGQIVDGTAHEVLHRVLGDAGVAGKGGLTHA